MCVCDLIQFLAKTINLWVDLLLETFRWHIWDRLIFKIITARWGTWFSLCYQSMRGSTLPVEGSRIRYQLTTRFPNCAMTQMASTSRKLHSLPSSVTSHFTINLCLLRLLQWIISTVLFLGLDTLSCINLLLYGCRWRTFNLSRQRYRPLRRLPTLQTASFLQ